MNWFFEQRFGSLMIIKDNIKTLELFTWIQEMKMILHDWFFFVAHLIFGDYFYKIFRMIWLFYSYFLTSSTFCMIMIPIKLIKTHKTRFFWLLQKVIFWTQNEKKPIRIWRWNETNRIRVQLEIDKISNLIITIFSSFIDQNEMSNASNSKSWKIFSSL
jgi:hypothetical protein